MRKIHLAILASSACLPSCKSRPSESGVLAAELNAVRAHDLSEYTCPTGDVPVAFFDADSTLRVSKSGSVSANGPDDVNLLPFVAPKIRELNGEGFLVAIVSNQGGIAQGHVTVEIAEGALRRTASMIKELGGRVDYIAYAPDNGDERKPKTGMATKLAAKLQEKCGKGIDMAKSFMVGDSGYKAGSDGDHPDGRPADDFSNADRGFARNLFYGGGDVTPAHFLEPTDYFGWRQYGVFNIENQGELEDFIETLEAAGKTEEVTNLRRVNQLTSRYRYLHYNIKELHTGKLTDEGDKQIARAAIIIKSLDPDLLSINEIQHDLPDVPLQGMPGTGQNMRRLFDRTGIAGTWTFNLAPANTGKRAKKKPDGNYAVDPNAPGSKELADPISFGTFPGQYSTGFGTRFPVTDKIVFTDLEWKDWDGAIDLGALPLPNGEPAPVDMELFDKNFNDVVVTLDGRAAHFVTFHTVPAFGFGGPADLNIARNKAQLEFLEWYLLGQSDESATASAVKRCATDIRPLAADTPFIAVGDLNVDWGTPGGGAEILKRLLENQRVHNWRAQNPDFRFRKDPTTNKAYITYMSDGVDLGKLQSELDYFLVSKHFRISHGKTANPLSWYEELSCHGSKTQADAALAAHTSLEDRVASVSTRYADDGSKTYCVVEVTKQFATFRQGSDHLPVYLTFGWAN